MRFKINAAVPSYWAMDIDVVLFMMLHPTQVLEPLANPARFKDQRGLDRSFRHSPILEGKLTTLGPLDMPNGHNCLSAFLGSVDAVSGIYWCGNL